LISTAAGLLALSLAASAVGTASATGQTGSRSDVPRRQVGPGWALAMDWPGNFGFPGKPIPTVPRLVLFNPAGVRYQLRWWPKTKNPPSLID
jgi:hypothetical protein